MGMEKQPFRKYNLDNEKTDSFTVRLNKEERKRLEEDKSIIEQKRDSTALKQLAYIGSIVIHERKNLELLAVLFKNKRNNLRNNIFDFD